MSIFIFIQKQIKTNTFLLPRDLYWHFLLHAVEYYLHEYNGKKKDLQLIEKNDLLAFVEVVEVFMTW